MALLTARTRQPRGQQQTTRGGARRLIRTAFHAGLGALLALYIGFFAAKCIADIRFPYTLDYGEGLVLSQAVRLAHGQGLYNDYTHYPFVFSNYPPVFVTLAAIGVKQFGVGFAFGRAIAFIAMLGVAVVMALLLRRCGTSLAPALAAPAFLLSTYWVTLWAGLMRVDTLALLLSMAGLYCVLRRGKWLVVAIVLLAVASYTKQSMVAALAAGFVYLWWTRRRRDAIVLVGSWAGIVLIVFAVFQITTRGWFYRHIVSANVNPWYADQTWAMFALTLRNWPVILIMGAASAVLLLSRRSQDRAGDHEPGRVAHCERLLVPYLVFAAIAAVTVGKGGAYVNYMIEPLAAACLVAARGYDALIRVPSRSAFALWAAVAVALSVQALDMWDPPSRWDGGRKACAEGGQAAARLIAITKGEVIGEPPGVVVLSGRPLLVDTATASYLALAGVWDQTALLRDLRRQRFALIYMTREAREAQPRHGVYAAKWSEAIMGQVNLRYRVAGSAGDLCFLVPKRLAGANEGGATHTGSRTE